MLQALALFSASLKKVRALLLMTLGLAACQNQGAAISKLDDILSGNASMSEFSMYYTEEHPMDWMLSFSLTGKSGFAHIVKKKMKTGCQAHWDSNCWQTTEKTRAISDEDTRLIIQFLASSKLVHANGNQVLAPGSEGVSLNISLPDIEPVKFRAKLQAFSSDPQLGELRRLILKLSEEI